ncbi:MAG: hypothetical protein WCF06_15745 [Nitrososphaeraceae archaeon]
MNSVLPKWETMLGGAWEFMWTHCSATAKSGRVDPTEQVSQLSTTFVYK